MVYDNFEDWQALYVGTSRTTSYVTNYCVSNVGSLFLAFWLNVNILILEGVRSVMVRKCLHFTENWEVNTGVNSQVRWYNGAPLFLQIYTKFDSHTPQKMPPVTLLPKWQRGKDSVCTCLEVVEVTVVGLLLEFQVTFFCLFLVCVYVVVGAGGGVVSTPGFFEWK